MITKSYYTLVQIAPNVATNDRVSIGLIGFDENNIKVRFSSDRQYIVKKLLGKGDTIVDDIVQQIELVLLKNPEKLQEKVVTKGSQDNWTANYLEYLQTYSNGTLRFSDTILVAEALTQERFDGLFDKFLGKNNTDSKIMPIENIKNKTKTENKEEQKQNNLPEYKDTFTYEGHILDKMYYSLMRFKDVQYLPSSFLITLYPFQQEEKYSHVSQYALNVATDDLEYFFQDCYKKEGKGKLIYNNTNQENIENIEEKLDYVIKVLNQSMIFYVQTLHNIGQGSIKTIDVNNYEENIGVEINDFEAMSFYQAFMSLQGNNEQNIETAYKHYCFGNYVEAYNVLQEISEKYKLEKRYFLFYISLYNIKNLKNLIQADWFNEIGTEKRIEIIKNIDVIRNDGILKEIKNWSNDNKQYELINLLSNNLFFYEKFEKITNLSFDIIEHYQKSKNGYNFISFNTYSFELYKEIIGLYNFYTSNCIFFEQFSNFKNIISKATEAVIASHSIKSTQNISKLEEIDSAILWVICNYNSPKKLLYYLNKYDLITIKPHQNIEHFINNIENLFDTKYDINDVFFNLDGKNTYFKNYLDNLINNVILVFSILEIDEQKDIYIIEMILSFFIKNTHLISYSYYNYIHILINQKNKYFQNENILALLILLFNKFLKESYRLEDRITLINNFVYFIKKYRPDFRLKDDYIITNITNISSIKGLDIGIYLYPILEKNIQDEIRYFIRNRIKEKFYETVCYNAILENILDPNEYISTFYEQGAYHYVIALFYEFSINIEAETLENIAKSSNFYDWLLNPKTFDYTKFEMEWFYEIRFPPIFEKISELEIVKNTIMKYIKQTNNDGLKDIYFKYFV